MQRWLKFVKYLPSFGVIPFVFAPENPSFDLRDESLLNDVPAEAEVIHFPIWEPYRLGKKISGSPVSNTPSSTARGGLVKNALTWLRGNLLFPDPRIFWVRSSVQFLEEFLRTNNIGTIITTGPPHSVHLIGLRLKKKNPKLKWIADFRDPWSEWGMLLSFKLTAMSKRIHQRMEKQVLTSADSVITITPFYVKQLERLSGRKVELITNGYDDSDFAELNIQRSGLSPLGGPGGQFVIRHVGVVNPSCDPRPFMNAVKKLATEDSVFGRDAKIYFTGQVNDDFRKWVESDSVLSSITIFQPGVPHNELISLYSHSSLLVLILTGYKDGEGFLPGKLFEYLATGLPIMAVGPVPSDANNLLRELKHGEMIASDNQEMIKSNLQACFKNWKHGHSFQKHQVATEYSRKQLTFKLVELLNTL